MKQIEKKSLRVFFAAVAMACALPMSAVDPLALPSAPIHLQGGPGIVTAMSVDQGQLPAAANAFLRKIYSRDAIVAASHNIIKDVYNVTVGNGTKITFDAAGKVKDIEAPQGETLYGRAVQAVLPEKTFRHLEDAGLLEDVTGIKNADSHGLRVQLYNATPPEMLFDIDGAFLIIDY